MPSRPAAALRAAFAARMAALYGQEVPAYNTLVEVASSVNADVAARDAAALRLGSLERVTAERHGAIRVGTPTELAHVGQIFGALGMYPVGFYDLREAAAAAVPVVSTAFRPVEPDELERNPFRMFTSLLVTDDRRFFSAQLQHRLDAFLARRTLFAPELLALADQAIAEGGLAGGDAEAFVDLASASFALSAEPIDRSWYAELGEVSAVAADIGAVSSTHINHLTPRVMDIDELYRQMTARGVAMIDEIQGPPRWPGPDVLLRQTSFRALAEQRRFREPDGTVTPGALRVRFGEVEARGIALTPEGRDRYDATQAEVDRRLAELQSGAATSAGARDSVQPRQNVASAVWAEHFPSTELGLLRDGLGFFTFSPVDPVRSAGGVAQLGRGDPPTRSELAALVEDGVLTATPIVYEDFLPRSAAGIFQSNLAAEGRKDATVDGTGRDSGWLSDVIGWEVADPAELYAAQQRASLDAIRR